MGLMAEIDWLKVEGIMRRSIRGEHPTDVGMKILTAALRANPDKYSRMHTVLKEEALDELRKCWE